MRKMVSETGRDLGELYHDESARLWRAVFAYTQDHAITDDAVAEAFAQCLRRGDAVRDPRAWVWSAAFRLAAGSLADRRMTGPLEDAPVTDPVGDDPTRLLAALRAIPGHQRAALVLRFYAGYDTAEIARMLGIGRATVRVHISRGRKRLRQLLPEEVDE
jgi:RNA polymerase sigma-70 factor (ECF subfamily)